MQSSSTFMRKLGPIIEVKKSVINDRENISYWEEPEQSKVLENKFCLFQIQLSVLGELQPQESFKIFTPI